MNHPLLPLKPIERLGWMRHFTSLRCRKACTGFTKGRTYAMRCATLKLARNERRTRSSGVTESIILTGHDLVIYLKSDQGWNHRFLERPHVEHPIIHDFIFLVAHFDIPEIPDVATLDPDRFALFQQRLHALES